MSKLDVFLSGLLCGAAVVVGARLLTEEPKPKPVVVDYPRTVVMANGERATLQRLDWCEYWLVRGELVHKGDCSNPAHLKGGVLLEDWNLRNGGGVMRTVPSVGVSPLETIELEGGK